MQTIRQFTSGLKNFYAIEIPEHAYGCTGVFNLYKVTTNENIGKLYDDGNFIPTYTGSSLSPNDLREIARLGQKIQRLTDEG